MDTRKFFEFAKSKWPHFEWDTYEDMIGDIGECPEGMTRLCKRNYNKPNSKTNSFWGTFSDEIKCRRRRAKQYFWRK